MTRSRCGNARRLVVLFLVTLGSLLGTGSVQAQSGAAAWTGEYFNNDSLSGTPALVREDPTINFFWPEYTSPAPGLVNADNYSVRWTRSINFDVSGTWAFSTTNDDGMRVWVDNAIAVDAWYDQGPSSHKGTLYLAAGWHTVRVEYYNRALGATARLVYSLETALPAWKGEYYSNPNVDGPVAVTRNDPAINFDWGTNPPDPGVPADHFSVRWTRTLYFSAGTWRFTTTTDDGVRLWVDGSLLIDQWHDQSVASYSGDIALTAGNHSVRMEYYDNYMNAVAQLSYALVAPSSHGAWHGQYYNNTDFSGAPALVRDDPSLHFNWGLGSPGPGITADYFSVKWDSAQVLPVTGNYRILVSADDGVRVWIDGTLVVDAWNDHSATLFSATRWLAAGAHNVHVEYYERTVNAMLGVDVTPIATPNVLRPDSAVASLGSSIIVDNRGSGWQAGGDAANWKTVASGIGGQAYWTYNNSFTVPLYNWARWYPTLSHAGNYEVYAYIPAGIATTTNARYWVHHNGSYDLVPRSQALYADDWVSLGTFYLSASGDEYVSLSDVTYECFQCNVVVFDAIKFTPR